MPRKTFDLFEHLQDSVGCEYISDLPKIAKTNPQIIADVLRTIIAEDFPLAQWNDALDYLLKASALNTAADAYTYLLSALSEAAMTR